MDSSVISNSDQNSVATEYVENAACPGTNPNQSSTKFQSRTVELSTFSFEDNATVSTRLIDIDQLKAELESSFDIEDEEMPRGEGDQADFKSSENTLASVKCEESSQEECATFNSQMDQSNQPSDFDVSLSTQKTSSLQNMP
eukprot:10035277-Ditylum_brightwellii.AAC.1